MDPRILPRHTRAPATRIFTAAPSARSLASRWLVQALGLLMIALILGCGRNPLGPLPPLAPGQFQPDNWPVMSRDGQWIAYHRRYPSSDGPQGLYLVNRWGGPARLLVAGDLFFPEYPRFSPDGSRLLAVSGLQLVIVDLASGIAWQPFYTHNLVRNADWSPDGRTIVYRRLGVFYGDPPDSGGIHFYDLATGADRVLRRGGQVDFGSDPLWSPDGSEIACIEQDPDGLRTRVCLMHPDGSGFRVIAESRPNYQFELLQWYVRRLPPADGLLFNLDSGPDAGTSFAARDGSRVVHFWMWSTPWYNTFSWDGSEIIRQGYALGDSAGGLFIWQADDASGASRRQVTFYRPPQNSPQLADRRARTVSRPFVLLGGPS